MADSCIVDPSGDSEEVVARTIESLKRNEATDTHLLEILTKHLVTFSPVENAIDLALEEIESLAKERGELVD